MSDCPEADRARHPIRRWAGPALLAAAAIAVIPAPVAAYIDPVSGSVLLQIVSAAVLAAAVTVGRARNWLLGLFRRAGRRKPADGE